VFLAIDPSTGEVECPYCSRRFIYRPSGGEPLVRPEVARDAKPSAT
jgi:ribosomal protein S27E